MKNNRSTNKPQDNVAQRTFFTVFGMAVLLFIAYLVLRPLPLDEVCDARIDMTCTCPSDPNYIKHRNLLIVDTTDPLRAGKVADIQELLSNFAAGSKRLFDWLSDDKRPDQTSVYLLSSTAPADMQPIAIFCSQAPDVSVVLGSTKAKIRETQDMYQTKVANALQALEGGVSADQSPIVETLAILTSNSSAWRPGGTLILVSDLLQNTQKCGFFERVPRVPPVGSLPAECVQDVRILQEKIRPTATYPGGSVIALCELPGKSRKEGLIAFWRDIFQESLGYDVVLTCDTAEIASRKSQLASLLKSSNLDMTQ